MRRFADLEPNSEPKLDPKMRPLFGPKFGTFCLFLYKEGPIFGDQNVTLFLGPKIGLVFVPSASG